MCPYPVLQLRFVSWSGGGSVGIGVRCEHFSTYFTSKTGGSVRHYIMPGGGVFIYIYYFMGLHAYRKQDYLSHPPIKVELNHKSVVLVTITLRLMRICTTAERLPWTAPCYPIKWILETADIHQLEHTSDDFLTPWYSAQRAPTEEIIILCSTICPVGSGAGLNPYFVSRYR